MDKVNKIYAYGLIYLIIGLSSSHLLMQKQYHIIVFGILLSIFAFSKRISEREKRYYAKIIFIVSMVFFLQAIVFNVVYIYSYFSLIVLFSISFCIQSYLKFEFINYYVSLVYYLSIISLIFYILIAIFPNLTSVFINLVRNIGIDPFNNSNMLIFNFRRIDIVFAGVRVYRNCGFTYEPGMFACILIPALCFNTIIMKQFVNFKNIIFIVALLTTFSTAAYLSMCAYFFLYTIFFKKRFLLKRLTFCIIIFMVCATSFWRLEIIGNKIESQYKLAIGNDSQRHLGRIGSGKVDLEETFKHPIIGKGRNVETRFEGMDIDVNDGRARHRVNGVFDLLVAMGIPFFLYYMYLLSISIKNICKIHNGSKNSWLIFVIPFLIMASSQTILFRPLFVSFIFLFLYKGNQIKNLNLKKIGQFSGKRIPV